MIHGPVYGGGHNQIIRLREPLLEHGWETVALVPAEPGTAAARLLEAGVEVVSLPLHRLRATADPLTHARLARSFAPEVGAIRRLLRKRSVDLVQVHGPTNPHAAIAARLEGIPVVWQLYDTRTPMALRRLTMPMVVRLADVVMTTGMEVARVHPGAIEMGERLVSFIPPVDPREFRLDPAARDSARRELGAPQDRLVVGTVGNLNPSKGHEHLVRAAALVKRGHPRTLFRILGAESPAHESYMAAVRQEAAALGDAVTFLDPGSRVADLMPGLDVFVLASVPRSEGVPTVIIEAMSCGLSIVTTEVGSVREVVDDGVNGFVIPSEDPAALARAIERLLADSELRLSMGLANRQAVKERYGIDRCIEAHVRAYGLALSRRGSRPAATSGMR